MAGITPDGEPKVRPIDDMSASGINAATTVAEKLLYDTLDLFHATIRKLAGVVGVRVCYEQANHGEYQSS